MNYIFDNDDTYIKKCETENCNNEVFVGGSRQFCKICLEKQGYKLEDIECKIIPYYDQREMH